MNTSISCVMRISLWINQGVRKVVLGDPYCESLYMYALNVIQAGEQFSVNCQKSWLIPSLLLCVVYDQNSQCYSRIWIIQVVM